MTPPVTAGRICATTPRLGSIRLQPSDPELAVGFPGPTAAIAALPASGFWIPCEAADAAPLDYELRWPARAQRLFHVSQDQIDEAMRAARQLWIDEQQDDTCRAVT